MKVDFINGAFEYSEAAFLVGNLMRQVHEGQPTGKSNRWDWDGVNFTSVSLISPA
jgi:hypothetical protein